MLLTYMNIAHFSSLVQASAIIGIGASAATLMGGMVFPNNTDWRDIASWAILGSLISSHYTLVNKSFFR